MSENQDLDQNIQQSLNLAKKSLHAILKNISRDTKEEYKDSEEYLKNKQQKESSKEALEKQEIEDRKSNRRLREKYAMIMFIYMCVWSFVVCLFLICSGLQWLQLDTWVLGALVGSMTVGVFTIVRAIIEGLFKTKN